MHPSKLFCSMCGKEFAGRYTLKRHVDTIHLKLTEFKCPYCYYKCNQKVHLKSHIRHKHMSVVSGMQDNL